MTDRANDRAPARADDRAIIERDLDREYRDSDNDNDNDNDSNNADTQLLATPSAEPATPREEVLAREQEQFGGMKFGSAFFGWLTATGTALLLSAIVAGVGAAFGYTLPTQETADVLSGNITTISVISAVVVLLLLFIAYFCGGYVAGRMSRFSGAKQGLAVWLWAILIAIVVAIIGAVVGTQFNILIDTNAVPWLPVNPGTLTIAGIISAVLALGVSLAGAVLGGLSGMRYHRAVDRAGFGV